MSYALIGSGTTKGGNASGVTTNTYDTTGAVILVAVVAYDAAGTGNTMADNKSNTWTALTAQTGFDAAVRVRIFWCNPTSVGSGHTFSYTGTNVYAAITVFAFSGPAISALDVQNGAGNGSATLTLQTGSVTPNLANELLVTGLGYEGPTNVAVTINQSFSTPLQTASVGGSSYGVAGSYLIETTATAKNPTWTLDTAAAAMAAAIATFTAGAAPQAAYLDRMRRI